MVLDNFWSISESLLKYIEEILPAGKTVLELGSGEGTKELVNRWNVVSVEHDKEFLNLEPGSNYIYAPLHRHKEIKNHDGNMWYDPAVMKKRIPELEYDLILIDGPCAPGSRAGFIKYFDLFRHDVPMIFDDINRYRDWKIILGIQSRLKRPITVPWAPEGKTFGVI